MQLEGLGTLKKFSDLIRTAGKLSSGHTLSSAQLSRADYTSVFSETPFTFEIYKVLMPFLSFFFLNVITKSMKPWA
jgi:hypothetical protein